MIITPENLDKLHEEILEFAARQYEFVAPAEEDFESPEDANQRGLANGKILFAQHLLLTYFEDEL